MISNEKRTFRYLDKTVLRIYLKRRMFEKGSDMTEWVLGAMNKRLHDEGINDVIID